MTNEELPAPGFGTYDLSDPQECVDAVSTALEVGYRHVDTAQMYDNEEHVGRGIAESDVSREDVFLATKINTGNLASDDVLETTEASLEKLGVDYVDLLYVHWPTNTYDPAETLGALDELHDDGKARHVGLSNFTPDLLAEARKLLDAPVFAHQVEMHPLLQQRELRRDAAEHGTRLVAYSPIARGEVFDVPELVEIAEKHDVTPAQVSLAWLMNRENVVPIPKSSSEAHIRENYEALSVELDDGDLERIASVDRDQRIVDPQNAPWNE